MTRQKPSKPAKPFWEMNLEELEQATAHYDREFIIDESEPLTPEMRRRWVKAKRKKPAHAVSNGKRSVSVSLAPALVERIDQLAQQRGVSRSAVVADGLACWLSRQKPRRKKAS